MTTTDPTTAQPATPGEALRWAANRIAARILVAVGDTGPLTVAAWLDTWARDLDAAPAAPSYALPAEPDGPLWYPDGTRFDRLPPPPELRYSDGARFADHWGRAGFAWQGGVTWQQLLCVAAGPLSSVPPAGTEGDR